MTATIPLDLLCDVAAQLDDLADTLPADGRTATADECARLADALRVHIPVTPAPHFDDRR